MAKVQATLRGQALFVDSPKEVVHRSNRILLRGTSPERFVTLFCGLLDASTHTFTYTNAGHNIPYFRSRDGHVTELRTGGTVLGILDNYSYEEERVSFDVGDVLLVYSDGVTEATNERGEEFGDQILLETLHRHHGRSAASLVDMIIAAVTEHGRGLPQSDDLTVLVLRRTA